MLPPPLLSLLLLPCPCCRLLNLHRLAPRCAAVLPAAAGAGTSQNRLSHKQNYYLFEGYCWDGWYLRALELCALAATSSLLASLEVGCVKPLRTVKVKPLL